MAISVKKLEGWVSKNKIAKLIKALETNDVNVRAAVIQALGKTHDEGAMHALIALLKDQNTIIRANTAEALGNMANGRSLEFVRQLWINEQDEEVREKARVAIAKIKANIVHVEKM